MPQPIDMQSEISRVTMAERIQDAATRGQLAAQQRAALESEERDHLRDTQVNESDETRDTELDPDGNKRDQAEKRRNKRKKPVGDEKSHTVYTANETKEILDDPDEHRLDITI